MALCFWDNFQLIPVFVVLGERQNINWSDSFMTMGAAARFAANSLPELHSKKRRTDFICCGDGGFFGRTATCTTCLCCVAGKISSNNGLDIHTQHIAFIMCLLIKGRLLAAFSVSISTLYAIPPKWSAKVRERIYSVLFMLHYSVEICRLGFMVSPN